MNHFKDYDLLVLDGKWASEKRAFGQGGRRLYILVHMFQNTVRRSDGQINPFFSDRRPGPVVQSISPLALESWRRRASLMSKLPCWSWLMLAGAGRGISANLGSGRLAHVKAGGINSGFSPANHSRRGRIFLYPFQKLSLAASRRNLPQCFLTARHATRRRPDRQNSPERSIDVLCQRYLSTRSVRPAGVLAIPTSADFRATSCDRCLGCVM